MECPGTESENSQDSFFWDLDRIEEVLFCFVFQCGQSRNMSYGLVAIEQNFQLCQSMTGDHKYMLRVVIIFHFFKGS